MDPADSIGRFYCLAPAVKASGQMKNSKEYFLKYLVIIAFLLAGPIVTLAQEKAPSSATITLTVQVTNGTQNGHPVAGDPVTLELYRQDELLNALNGIADAEGKIIFEKIPTGDSMIAIASAKHNNMLFNSPPLAINQNLDHPTLAVQVFEISEDASVLSVDIHHIIIKLAENALQVSEYLRLVNPSETAITSQKKDPQDRPIVLNISLPQGFTDLQSESYFEPHALVTTVEGFYDTMAVPPGTYDLSFTYNLPVETSVLEMEKTFSFSTKNVVIFSRLGSLTLEGLGPPENQFANAEGLLTSYYSKTDLKPGDTIRCTITGFNSNPPKTTVWVITSIAFAGLLLLAITRFFRKPEHGS